MDVKTLILAELKSTNRTLDLPVYGQSSHHFLDDCFQHLILKTMSIPKRIHVYLL